MAADNHLLIGITEHLHLEKAGLKLGLLSELLRLNMRPSGESSGSGG